MELGKSYKLQVSASNEIGESQKSVARTLRHANVPSAPQSLVLTAAIKPDEIKAEWTAPASMNGDSVSGYRVYLDDGFGGPFTLVYDGKNVPSTYSFTVEQEHLTCSRRYSV